MERRKRVKPMINFRITASRQLTNESNNELNINQTGKTKTNWSYDWSVLYMDVRERIINFMISHRISWWLEAGEIKRYKTQTNPHSRSAEYLTENITTSSTH